MPRRRLPPPAVSALLGVALALTLPPLPTGVLAPFALAGLLWYAARADTPRQVAGRVWWAVFAMNTLHLWWLTAFLGNIFGFPPAGALAFVLYALEGGFFALMAYVVARLVASARGRVWALAGGWGLVEALRFLGPLAFPWPTLGYALLPTPLIQVADLGGVLLASGLILGLAAALASRSRRSVLTLGLVWLAALGYGLTRTPGQGPEQPMRVLRTTFDAFGRASGYVTPEQQLTQQLPFSVDRPAGSVVVWSETALMLPALPADVPQFPAPGISGLRTLTPDQNSVISIDAAGKLTGQNVKAKLVPFGEEFPFYSLLKPVYGVFEQALGFEFGSLEAARQVQPLTLNGVQYGTYVCYDSVFPWVARELTRKGAQLLVNPSNDGWYQGWGVAQHFWMGRVRAIETRRWLVRSVNLGVAGAVDDLGRPVQVIASGDAVQALDVRPKLLSGQTVYARLGDLPALLLFAVLLGAGWARRHGRADASPLDYPVDP
ncbi:apolipoprotein N-acyltransferase [Deinococcus wulumuqiensis]|uniref:Apolipoprotein N-acyltransferase n=1 Tax=Deinococcus wulumuqiensis TaxID=980427 RepID=A0AAV4K1S0_9DEIO|nr:apolipoprotein N-acyltransferase [Deinococcus wulumuqiensis]GGI75941.1 apolipoprotein N-acyltransferase [Deinococcus wulumuqiensis]GGP28784.1 apolipoprotein N-acyltransferase [Deinococcus wulumuqiensis]